MKQEIKVFADFGEPPVDLQYRIGNRARAEFVVMVRVIARVVVAESVEDHFQRVGQAATQRLQSKRQSDAGFGITIDGADLQPHHHAVEIADPVRRHQRRETGWRAFPVKFCSDLCRFFPERYCLQRVFHAGDELIGNIPRGMHVEPRLGGAFGGLSANLARPQLNQQKAAERGTLRLRDGGHQLGKIALRR